MCIQGGLWEYLSAHIVHNYVYNAYRLGIVHEVKGKRFTIILVSNETERHIFPFNSFCPNGSLVEKNKGHGLTV